MRWSVSLALDPLQTRLFKIVQGVKLFKLTKSIDEDKVYGQGKYYVFPGHYFETCAPQSLNRDALNELSVLQVQESDPVDRTEPEMHLL